MEIPKLISEFFERHKLIPVLIFGIFIGFVSANFFYERDIDILKTLLNSKNELITEYRERLQIREKNEGPYQFYTDIELKNRVIELSRQIEKLCEQNPLLSIGKNYQEDYDRFKTNPEEFDSEPFRPGSQFSILYDNKEYMDELNKIEPQIKKEDVGLTIGELVHIWHKRFLNAIEPELKRYNNNYMQDAIDLKNEMLSRMPPRAWRHYRGHVDPENPGQFLIGVAIQLREIANDLIK
jgi:hypothetical protein